jgi:hypothetical protein
MMPNGPWCHRLSLSLSLSLSVSVGTSVGLCADSRHWCHKRNTPAQIFIY